MAFCDFCTCEDCREGTKCLGNASTEDGRYICDVCYYYEVCLDAGMNEPCPKHPLCAHRPILTSEWNRNTQ